MCSGVALMVAGYSRGVQNEGLSILPTATVQVRLRVIARRWRK
jgi:hypothetical protein